MPFPQKFIHPPGKMLFRRYSGELEALERKCCAGFAYRSASGVFQTSPVQNVDWSTTKKETGEENVTKDNTQCQNALQELIDIYQKELTEIAKYKEQRFDRLLDYLEGAFEDKKRQDELQIKLNNACWELKKQKTNNNKKDDCDCDGDDE